ncbi:putative ABC transport system permease protein [Breoghania corrubedonensis]|uniref:Putative ABC transport system permease protein n=1 Tax=Breoghania corrubedonensis TaxID=665038 RepID=A0A2T5VAA2_9HYPH|nr:ABC transporter permease [Breoghania corrubedonensis]PTW60685.1 putative ABC transport system permease protein [Breoghania corrubedonensis]
MMNPLPLVIATLRRNPVTTITFIALVAVAVGLGVAITSQERALKRGSAHAADRFDLVIAAPGSQTDAMLKAVFLRTGSVELLKPEVVARVFAEPHAEIVAPIAFGDSHDGAPIVGSVPGFVTYLSGGKLAEGRPFADHEEAVVGAASPLKIGDTFHPTHGDGHAELEGDGEEHGHDHEHGVDITVVGRMAPTGSPWDMAIVVPVELTWELHNLPTGHPQGSEQVGPPYVSDRLPGVPALVVKPDSVAAAYGLRNIYRAQDSTAFFPAEVLVELYALLGDMRQLMNVMALATQTLVIVAILVGIMVLLRLYRVQFSVLRALGAPRSFIFLTIWSYVALIVAVGAVAGLGLGMGLAGTISAAFTAQTGIALDATIGASEIWLVMAIIAIGMAVATVPAALLYRKPVIDALR